MNNVVVVGVGALGKRHLSSILKSRLELNVYCYDINTHAMDDFEWENTYGNKTLRMLTSFDQLPKNVDFALLSMTAKDRRKMFEHLINHCNVKNILFEKVLFQKPEDYEYVGTMLKKYDIKAWVNCSRRQMDCYQELKKKLKFAKEMRIMISGGEWGLACNCIHEIDLIEFLSCSANTTVDKINLAPQIVESKRKGFKEIYGTIEGHSGRCVYFSISCMKDTRVPIVISISSDIGQYIIFEGKGKMVFTSKENDYEILKKDFIMPYQSQMTQKVMEDILLNGDSRLTKFDMSSRLHLEFIRPLMKFFNKSGWEHESCPIT